MHFRGIRVIPAAGWNRSTELDNVLGYFDPKDRYIKLREDLLADPAGLQDNILIALGESLLGRYIRRRRWIEHDGARRYEITLETPARRACLLTDAQLRAYLALARMTPDPADPGIFRITLNREDGFLPPGLLFGLVYAWYLTGRSFTMEYEMTPHPHACQGAHPEGGAGGVFPGGDFRPRFGLTPGRGAHSRTGPTPKEPGSRSSACRAAGGCSTFSTYRPLMRRTKAA